MSWHTTQTAFTPLCHEAWGGDTQVREVYDEAVNIDAGLSVTDGGREWCMMGIIARYITSQII